MCSKFSIFLATYFTFGFLLTSRLTSAMCRHICFRCTSLCLALSPMGCLIMFPFASVIMCSKFSILLTTYFTFGFLLTSCLTSTVYSYLCFRCAPFCLALSPMWCFIMFPLTSVIMCSKFSVFLATHFTFGFLLTGCLTSIVFGYICLFCTIFYHTFFPMCIFIMLPRNIKKMFTLYDKCYILISLCGNSNLIIFWKCSFYCNCSVFYIDYTFRHRNCLLIFFNSCNIGHPLRCFF